MGSGLDVAKALGLGEGGQKSDLDLWLWGLYDGCGSLNGLE